MEFTHIGLVLSDLRAAEDFYIRLFKMEVFCREAMTQTGWKTLDNSIGWDQAAKMGFEIGMIVLTRLAFALAIERSQENEFVAPSHIGVFIPEPEFSLLRENVLERGFPYKSDLPQRFVFSDPFKMWWEITSDTRLYTARDRGYGWIDDQGHVRGD